MESCIVIANKKDLVKSQKVLDEKEKKLKQVCDYFDIPKLIICSLKKAPSQKTMDIFNEICKDLWDKKLTDPRYAQEFKVASIYISFIFIQI